MEREAYKFVLLEGRRVKELKGRLGWVEGSILLCVSQSEKCRLDDRTCAPFAPHTGLVWCAVLLCLLYSVCVSMSVCYTVCCLCAYYATTITDIALPSLSKSLGDGDFFPPVLDATTHPFLPISQRKRRTIPSEYFFWTRQTNTTKEERKEKNPHNSYSSQHVSLKTTFFLKT